MGNGDSLCATQYTTIEAIEKARRAALSKVPAIQIGQVDTLLELVNRYELEVVLFAIDDLSQGNQITIPDPANLFYHIKDAEATLAHIQLRRSIG